jgi:hypothetical protein
MTSQQIGILTSYDAWEKITDDLRKAALKVGLTKLGTYNHYYTLRKPYAAVFYGTDGETGTRDVIERMESNDKGHQDPISGGPGSVTNSTSTDTDKDSPQAIITTIISTINITTSLHGSAGIMGSNSTNALWSSNGDIVYPTAVVDSFNNLYIGFNENYTGIGLLTNQLPESMSGPATNTNTTTIFANGALIINNYTDSNSEYSKLEDNTLLKFDTERPWSFKHNKTGASTELLLNCESNNKRFVISAGDRQNFIFNVNDNADGTNSTPKFIANGDIEYTGSITDTSDDRIKFNETIINGFDALDVIKKLNLYNYEKITKFEDINTIPTDEQWNSVKENWSYILSTGFIAQEVEQIEELQKFVITNDNGIKSINYNGIFIYLTASVKELINKQETIETENIQLKNRVSTLENLIEQINSRLSALESQ